VVLDPLELDALLPSWVANALTAHGAVVWALDIGLAALGAEVLYVKHLHGTLGHELVGLLVQERLYDSDLGQQSIRRGCDGRELSVVFADAFVTEASQVDRLTEGNMRPHRYKAP